TGELPYSAANAQAMMRAKTTTDPDPPRRHRPDLTPGLEEIVMHAIARSPRDRYENAAAMLEDLRDPAAVLPGSRTAHVRAGTRVSRRTVFTVVVVAVFALLLVLTRLSSHPPPSAAPAAYRGGGR
ncbi:MAG TPA: hypothetical protein VHZ95_16000, partial [Polyangiales bacterium]|nr:hypothetical protein [Polyangiales bacterium]